MPPTVMNEIWMYLIHVNVNPQPRRCTKPDLQFELEGQISVDRREGEASDSKTTADETPLWIDSAMLTTHLSKAEPPK